jgi:hypothetical protein
MNPSCYLERVAELSMLKLKELCDRVFVPFATIQNWVEAGGKKGAGSHGQRVSRLGSG